MAEKLPEGLEELPEGLVPITSNSGLPEGLEALPEGLVPIDGDSMQGETPSPFMAGYKEQAMKTPTASMFRFAESQMGMEDDLQDVEEGLTDEAIQPPSADYEARRQAFIQQKQQERDAELKALEQQSGRSLEGADWVDKAAYMVGSIAGAATDPTMLIMGPIGAGGKLLQATRLAKLSAAGATYEGTAAALEQETRSGEITDWQEIAERAGMGAVVGPAGDVVLRGIGRGVKRVWDVDGYRFSKLDTTPDAIFSPKEQKLFAKTVDKLQEEIDLRVASGEAQGLDALALAEKNLGIPPERTMHLTNATGKDIHIPTLQEAQEGLLRSEFTVDKWGNPTLANKLLTPVIDRIKSIDPEMHNAVRKWMLEAKLWYHTEYEATKPMRKLLQDLPSLDKRAAESALRNGKFVELKKIFDRNGLNAVKAIADHRASMDRFAKQYTQMYGKKWQAITDYSPRLIKDVDEFIKRLRGNDKNIVQKALQEAEANLGKGEKLTEFERSKIINNALFRGVVPGHARPDATFKRRWKEIPAYMDDLYADYGDAMHHYVRQSVNDISKRKFLGRNAVKDASIKGLNYEASIGALLSKKPKLLANRQAMDNLSDMLVALMYHGEKSPSKSIQTWRNIVYGFTLGNPVSALTQLKDVGFSAVKYGLVDTLKSALGPKTFKAVDFGLKDAAEELITSPSKSARFMEWTLQKSGFQKADLYGKEVILNAAYRKWSRLGNPKLPNKAKERILAELTEKYGEGFGKDFPALVSSLRAGKIDNNVKLLMFHELSDMQPISRAEMPEAWLRHPDGRMLYTLKSFQLRQFSTILRDTVKEIAAGNVAKGTGNLVKYASYLAGAGVSVDLIKDFVKGEVPELTMENVGEKAVNNLLNAVMLDTFMAKKMAKTGQPFGELGRGLGSVIDIPFAGVKDAYQIAMEDINPKDSKSLQYIPIIGRLYYYWIGGGAEKSLSKGKDRWINK